MIILNKFRTRNALWSRSEGCIIFVGYVINGHDYTVIFLSTTVKVAHLEVESPFCEPIEIGDIVRHVQDVECIHDGGIKIAANARLLTSVITVVISHP